MTEKIKPLTLEVDKKVWEEFKERVPRSITLSQKIEELIKQFLYKK